MDISLDAWKLERGAEPPDLTKEETDDRSSWIVSLTDAQQVRDSSMPEWDDMDYLTNYLTNQKADLAYVPPKKNQQDYRVVTGTTHEKGNSLLSALLNYNFQAEFTPFDEDDMPLFELGESMSSLLKKSREMEDWERKRPYIYRELLAQGTCFVLERWFEERVHRKTVAKGWDRQGVDLSKFKLEKDEVEILPGRGEATLQTGTKVYLGNIREPDISKQPKVFVLEQMPWSQFRSIYSGWSRFKNVPKKISNITNDTSAQITFRDWTLLTTRFDFVEVAHCFDKPNNTYQLLCNGVPMLPVGFPLTEVSPSGEYPVAKGDVEVTPFFAYAKSIPSKTKVEQVVLDEMVRLAVLKTLQSFTPAMANNTGKQFRRSMLFPATIHNDIDPEKLKPIMPATGMTQPEMAFLGYMKELIDSKSISAVWGGEAPQKNTTATQVIEEKKASLMKLGQAVWGVVQLERQLAWLRNWNHIANLTKPQMEKYEASRQKVVSKWRSFTMEDDLDNGEAGLKVIEFNPEMAQTATPEMVKAEEDLLTRKYRKPTRLYYIDPNALREAKLTWHCSVTPTEEGTSELQRVMFVQNIQDAAAIFGPQSLNFGYLKKRFAAYMKEDPDVFFAQEGPANPLMGMMAPGGSQVPGQIMNGVQQPSLNQALAPAGA